MEEQKEGIIAREKAAFMKLKEENPSLYRKAWLFAIGCWIVLGILVVVYL